MSKVSMRTSCPSGYDKNYMRTANGGWNTCIQGTVGNKRWDSP